VTCHLPRERSYTSKGFVRTTYDVRLASDTVVLTTRSSDRNGPTVTATRRVPTSDEWRAFWRAASDAGVRRWPAACEDASILDGGGFTFALAWADGRRSGDYVNSFPTQGGVCRGSTSEATTFVNAVHALAGVTYRSFAP